MASHAYCRFILQTPDGYLTPTGASKDIGDENVVVLNIYGVGGAFSSREKNIKRFLEHTTAAYDPEQCKVLYYCCPMDYYYECEKCPKMGRCEFWTNLKECKFQ